MHALKHSFQFRHYRALLIVASLVCTQVSIQTSAAAGPDQAKSKAAINQLQQYLKLAASERTSLDKESFSQVALTREDAKTAQQLLWKSYLQYLKQSRKQEMTDRKIKHGNLEMPFYYTKFGNKPATGRSMYISMHGGGGAPKQVNDQQWENQKRLYRLPEGVYVVPRAPTNTWNLWHQGHIDPMFQRLIQNLIAFEDVDPNRVYIMGYSAGGDGTYQLAPRMADRLAAAAMMAGHPNEASPLGLRNIGFTIHMGGKDAAYNRNKVAAAWGTQLANLQKEDPGGYRHLVKIYPNKGHWMDREDAVAIPWMAKFRRNPFPDRVVWRQDDVTHNRFYWLAVDDDNKRKGSVVEASVKKQQIEIKKLQGIEQLIFRANDQLVDLDQPVTVTFNGQQLFHGTLQRTVAMISKTLVERGDPASIFSAEVAVSTVASP